MFNWIVFVLKPGGLNAIHVTFKHHHALSLLSKLYPDCVDSSYTSMMDHDAAFLAMIFYLFFFSTY